MKVVRAAFHAELDELIADLARRVRLAGGMINNASIALHQSDPALAGRVIAERDQTNAMLDDTERRCITLLALQAPVAGDLRVVIAAFRAVGHVRRMANLARHIAIIAQPKHPNPPIPGEVRPVLARMSLLASQLAEDAATAIEHQDPLSGDRLAVADDEVDALRRHLVGILFTEDWSHGVEQAVNVALMSRYYERFADHAVAIAGQVCYVATGRIPEPNALETTSAPGPP
ncbi:MAG TPA: phosphate signaling complex protein PhoU [Pseudonocardiaceae bacterium]|nr:phosphate signaling complex protein PhoU [Pseudonocardiaceae bacterium]